ncbi:MAG: tetratricopeptide repeat protein, partial [Myxococcales bacterium]|nr:tetratricopeptide repeat protein [Myxococcales bacterium]
MSDNHSAQRGRARPWGAALLLAGLCAGCNDPNTQAPPQPKSLTVDSPAEQAKAKDDAYVDRYQQAKQRIADLDVGNPMAVKGAVNQLAPDLREIADKAKDSHLRANASLLLGSLYQTAGDNRSAIAFYRQARGLLPDEIEPARVLALALGADGQYKEAAALQVKVVEDDMDDLEAWLLLGELHLKAGDEEEAKKAYIRYEIRRKGLLDGLTLR